jgi:hypothetical protein
LRRSRTERRETELGEASLLPILPQQIGGECLLLAHSRPIATAISRP